MCGIAGIMDFRERVDLSVLERASQCMAHRGPDGQGFFLDGPVGFVHRRLAIIDIGGGAQPMANEDQSVVVIFNGEIYNFVDLRRELQSKGHCFRTSSDTEVILHGYEEWGTDCVDKFEGMFAFALFDRKDSSLFLARDRCGEKPLYYFHKKGRFLFASEIQTLLTLIGQIPAPDPGAIYLYLRLGYIPAPFCFYSGVRKMQAGSCLLLRGNQHRNAWSYYKPGIGREQKATEDDLCDELEATLRRAVKRMLVADVPLGAYLSGGLDSSLIAALMAKEGSAPRTFSISFNEGTYDESAFARLASRAVGTEHVQYRVKFGDIGECLSIMDGFGEPFADSSAVPTYYLARETRKRVTVALSGDGGDELFAGYRRYVAQRLVQFYMLIPDRVRSALIERLISLQPERDVYYADSFLKSVRIFTGRCRNLDAGSELMMNTFFSHEEIISLFPELPDGRATIQAYLRATTSNDGVRRLMHADRTLYLPDDILSKVDRMSMRSSLEVRSPFLDVGMLALADRIPLSMKIKGLNQKYLLKKVALRYLPREIVFRKKHGFMPPMAQWIRDAGRAELSRRMPTDMKVNAVGRLLSEHFQGRVDHSHKLFALMVLGRYMA